MNVGMNEGMNKDKFRLYPWRVFDVQQGKRHASEDYNKEYVSVLV